MRVVLLILILAVVVLIVALATGLVSFQQTRRAQLPEVTTANGVAAKGGQTPAFDVETGSVAVGSRQRNVSVEVPTLEVKPANSQASNATGAP